ncbi:MAG: hypothetical protein JNK60_03660 [Acidobacteria bacterium]|nr:hypothetical protein [Acidobacteriota bacterium]
MTFLRGSRFLLAAPLLASVLQSVPSVALPPHLVKDIDDATQGAAVELAGATPSLVFFEASHALYRSDGTVSGTFPISNDTPNGDRKAFAATLGNTLLFAGNRGLVRTDGTVEGTMVLKEPGQGSYATLAKLGGFVYFDLGFSLPQIWRTDGTPAGTSLFRQLTNRSGGFYLHATSDRIYFEGTDSGLTGLFSSNGGPEPPVFLGTLTVRAAQAVGPRLFFITMFPSEVALWVSDGTKAGTVRLLGPPELPQDSVLGVCGDKLLFMGQDAAGKEPWVSDGTEAGTKRLADLGAGAQSSDVQSFATLGSKAYFVSEWDLWETDGTPAGTRMVLENLGATEVVAAGQRLLLGGETFTSPSRRTLWVSDGTAGGTVDVHPDPEGNLQTRDALPLSGRIFFPYYTDRFGTELWATDGTPAGTGLLLDIEKSTLGGGFSGMAAGATHAYFMRQGVWSSDGTESGTRQVVLPGPDPAPSSGHTVAVGDVGYFCGNAGVFRMEGSGSSTVRIATEPCVWIVPSGGTLYFLSPSALPARYDLWRSDGMPGGSQHVSEVPVSLDRPVAFQGGILFSAHTSQTGFEPWISDGTPAGTHLLKDVVPGPLDGSDSTFFAGPTRAFFRSGISGSELWVTDGTDGGTHLVPLGGLVLTAVAGQIGDILYFFLRTPSFDERFLWRTDGTAAGTWTVKTLPEGYVATELTASPVVSGGTVYFVFYGLGENAAALWGSDGTEAGTRVLRTFPQSTVGLQAVPGGLAFATWEAIGYSDGTPEGTRFLGPADVRLQGPSTVHLVRVGSMLLFAGWDSGHGEELWRADLVEEARLFYTVEPCRAADTRAIDGSGSPMIADSTREFPVTGRCGIPADAVGVVLNVTVVNPSQQGYVEVLPAGLDLAVARSTSFSAGSTRASSTILGLVPASRGQVSVCLRAPGSAHVVLDVSGYFK